MLTTRTLSSRGRRPSRPGRTRMGSSSRSGAEGGERSATTTERTQRDNSSRRRRVETSDTINGGISEENDEAGDETWRRQQRKGQVEGAHTLLRYFRRQHTEDYERAAKEAFKAHGRRVRHKQIQYKEKRRRTTAEQHRQDRTIGINTLNVRGLATDIQSLGAKLQGLKEQHARGNRDVVFIHQPSGARISSRTPCSNVGFQAHHY